MKVLLTNARKRAVRGLTLIELVVVLAILVALVGLVLAFFPGLLAKASRSTSASSIQDVARAVQINYTTALTYGNGFDSLLTSPAGTALFSKLPPNAASQMAAGSITAAEVTGLAALGITTVYHLNNGLTGDATFNVSVVGTPVILSATTSVATITDTAVQNALRGNYIVQGTGKYVVFGLNKAASIIGSSSILQDAPVRAGANAAENPTTSYQRYGLVFLLDNGPNTTRTARFLGAVAFASTGITTAESNLQEYYSN